MTKQNTRVKLLCLTNIISLIFLAIVSLHYQVPQKVFIKLGIIKNNSAADTHYDVKNLLFSVYGRKEYRTVMLGDSITEGAAWNELLGIPDIANRGIGGDTSEGFYKRLPDIYGLNPELCFIMGGINDIFKGIPVKSILENMRKTVEELEGKGIKPVMQTALYVSKTRKNWKNINGNVDELNKGLKEMCAERGIIYADINEILSSEGGLREEYTYDGVHLYGRGYREWGKKVKEIIEALR